jgi:hypothetical protein
MKPFLLWARPHAVIAQYLDHGPDDFTVIDTNHVHELQKLHKLRRDSPVFDPFPTYGEHYRDVLNHLTTIGCRYHVVGLEACQDVLRRLKDPSLSGATLEEILLALGYPKKSNPETAVPPTSFSRPTIFLSRLIGLLLILVSLAMLLQKQTMLEITYALLHDRPLLLIVGLIALIGGLAMVLGHNVWSGGILPVVVTVFGWVILIRGSLILFLPADVMVRLWTVVHFDELFYFYAGVVMALGLYLTYAGFRSTMRLDMRRKR